jgi:hypothetical protein
LTGALDFRAAVEIMLERLEEEEENQKRGWQKEKYIV